MFKWLFCFIIAFQMTDAFAQKDILIPFRQGNKFGLSDETGRIKLKPVYDFVEPIGNGYFKYANYNIVPDTVWYANGRMEVNENKLAVTGVLKGTKQIIPPTKHNHFRLVDNSILIGSEESYISMNSNFYTLNGKKLLPENVEKFRFLSTGADEFSASNPAFISIFTENYNETISLFLFDTKKQKIHSTLLDQVQNFKLDRQASSASELICSYTDTQYNFHQVRIYFDVDLQHHVKENYSKPEPEYHNDLKPTYREGEAEFGYGVPVEAPSGKPGSVSRPAPPPIVYFVKQSDSLIRFGEQEVKLRAGERVLFSGRHVKQQKNPLILTKGLKKCLLISDSKRSEYFDSLRYIQNRSVFSGDHLSFVYLAGNKNQQTGAWEMGILDEMGNEIIPMKYESIEPNIHEIAYERDFQTRQEDFIFKPSYGTPLNDEAPLILQRDGHIMAKKNGKYGVLNLRNEILLPLVYDALWKNGLSFLKTVPVDEEFYVYQTGSKYGTFRYFIPGGVKDDTGLIFPHIPVYMYKDYAGKSGFNLYNLAVSGDLFFCLAGSDGTLFYQP